MSAAATRAMQRHAAGGARICLAPHLSRDRHPGAMRGNPAKIKT